MLTKQDQSSRTIIRSTRFVDDGIVPALTGFHAALASRWLELVVAAIAANSWEFPVVIQAGPARAANPRNKPYDGPVFEPPFAEFPRQQDPVSPPLWDFSDYWARLHIDQGHCLALVQIQRNQYDPDSLASLAPCEGRVDRAHLNQGPTHLECGVASILYRVVDWAWAERTHIFGQLPLFDYHDLDALEQARDDLVRLGDQLTLNRHGNPNDTCLDPQLGLSELGGVVDSVGARDGDGPGWWTEWTGLQAKVAYDGFFSSVAPTLNNQSVIAGYLANLYANRATIINNARNNVLYAIRQATGALDSSRVVDTHITAGSPTFWKGVQSLGSVVTVGGSFSGPVAPAAITLGVSMIVVGLVGEHLDITLSREAYTDDMIGVVQRLNADVRSLDSEIEGFEQDYLEAVNSLYEGVNTVHSFNLELYDHTQNNPEGTPGDRAGFEADIDVVLDLAARCYRAGELYAGLLPLFNRIALADRHLAGSDGTPTRGDQKVVEMRDLLESFLKTSAGRYLVAGDMVKEAADSYADTDDELRAQFNKAIDGWQTDSKRPDDIDVPFNPDRYAGETDRDIDPAEHPLPPRLDDGDSYRIEPDIDNPPDSQ